MNFTVDRLKAAYKKSGLKPVNGMFVDYAYGDDGKKVRCGCALTALLIAECGMTYEEIEHLANTLECPVTDIASIASEKLNEKAEYIESFIHGFDDYSSMDDDDVDIFYQGKEAWDAVKGGVE
jgi:hypothetical protein